MNILYRNGKSVALIDPVSKIVTGSDVLDAIVNAQYLSDCIGIIIPKSCFTREFFDLKTGTAGDILQKCMNYNIKLAIVGDFSSEIANSTSFRDLVRECNRGTNFYFKESLEEAVECITVG